MGCFTFSHFFLGFGLPFFVLLNLLVELLFYCCLRNLQHLGFKTEKLELKGMDIGIVHGSSFILFLFFIFHFFIDDED